MSAFNNMWRKNKELKKDKEHKEKWNVHSNSVKHGIKSAPSPKVQKDYSPKEEIETAAPAASAPKKKERQKTVKTDASLVDKLGALQLALGDKNRTVTFRRLLKAGIGQLIKGDKGRQQRYRDAYKLLHHK